MRTVTLEQCQTIFDLIRLRGVTFVQSLGISRFAVEMIMLWKQA